MTNSTVVDDTVPVAPSAPGPKSTLARVRAVDVTVTTVAFWMLLAAGLALRIVLVFTNAFTIDSDNAIVYLISKHISEGTFSWFFWGQPYGGTLLEFTAGAAMVVFGPSFQVLAIVGVLYFAAATLLVRVIAARAFDSRVAGNVAGVVFWFSGYWIMRVGISEPGFYGPSLLLGLLTIWLVLRGETPRKSFVQWALIGFVAGLALWQSPMGIALAAPAVLIALIRHRSVLHWLVGAMAAIVGALPWIIEFVTTDRNAVKPQVSGGGIQWHSFVTIFSKVFAGAFSFSDTGPRYAVAIATVLLIALLAVLAVLGLRRRNWWLTATVLATVAVVIVVVIGTGIPLLADSVRYSVFIMPAVAISVGWIVSRVPFVSIVAMLLAVGLTVGQLRVLVPMVTFDTSHNYGLGDIKTLGSYLEGKGITAAYADYWMAYTLAAESNERVTAASLSNPRRYSPYEAAAAKASEATIIVLRDNDNDKMLQTKPGLPAFTRVEVSDYAVYTFDQPFDTYAITWALY